MTAAHFSDSTLNHILDEIADKGICILDNAIPAALNQALLDDVYQLKNALKPASIGRQSDKQQNTLIRRDKTFWFDGKSHAQQSYLDHMASLQLALNRSFYLGLFDFECHYAHYQSGDFYKKHLDAFRGRSNRKMTTVSYLNDNDQGGELVIYQEKSTDVLYTVTPKAGRLVIFESERFAHEVKEAKMDRYSIAGWFRINSSGGDVLDPAR